MDEHHEQIMDYADKADEQENEQVMNEENARNPLQEYPRE